MENPRKGTSMLEVIMVVAIIAAFGLIATMSLVGRRGTTEFDGTVKQVVAVLREAQSRSMSQSSSTTWGVYLSNATSGPFFALFGGASYSAETQKGFHSLTNLVAFSTSSIPEGGSKTVLFSQITGGTSSTTIQLFSLRDPAVSSTIRVASSGAVSY